jgi:Uma2 family endonuclease
MMERPKMSTTFEPEAQFRYRKPKRGEPVWEMALKYPFQGEWTEEAYLKLDDGRQIEFTDGCLEFLPMPVPYHQRLAKFVFLALEEYVRVHAFGEALLAPTPVRLRPGQYREPDVLWLKPGRLKDPKQVPDGADLVVEIVSDGEDSRQRDFVTKREEYAEAGIPEYWIVDPEAQCVTVLVLDQGAYREHGIFASGQMATSLLLPGFTVDVAALFAAGAGPQH